MKRKIFITGCTGVMGFATVKAFLSHLDRYELILLARPSRKNKRKLRDVERLDGVRIIWGDLLDAKSVNEGVKDADVVLHIGGMVSPMADSRPRECMKVNITSARLIVDALRRRSDADNVALVNIGSVAETSGRYEPVHWGRTGDPVLSAPYDYYGLSKIMAERIIACSGLKKWVSLRQSGILYSGILLKGTYPISFHVPLRGVLEWTTLEDSANLMLAVCSEDVPDEFWREFYNVGSGKSYRLTNYDFMRLMMQSLHCPPPERVFEPSWFATRNFHGMWYADSDRLESMLHFRENVPAEEYFARLSAALPFWFRLAPLAPASLIKWFMRRVALSPEGGTLDWLRRTDCEGLIKAFFVSREIQKAIGGWHNVDVSSPSETPVLLNHGYDESVSDKGLGIEHMRGAAAFRGGKCLSSDMKRGDIDTPLEWECGRGHRFRLSPRIVLKGGHWCSDCLPAPWRYDEESRFNKFLAQVWLSSHKSSENEIYDKDSKISDAERKLMHI